MKPQKPRFRVTADKSQHDKDPSLLKGHNSQIIARFEAFNSQAMVLCMNKIVSSGTIYLIHQQLINVIQIQKNFYYGWNAGKKSRRHHGGGYEEKEAKVYCRAGNL